jgi:uncharacterized membrane protein YbhN (UPF0104 family)
VLHTVLLIAQLDILSDLGGWFEEVWDQIRSVDIKYLILGCTLQTIQTSLNGLAWHNILAESYGRERTPVRQLIAAYAGGIGLNSFLPAQAGTFAYFGMFRVIIVGSAFAGILAAGVVQNLFFGVIGTLNYVFLFFSRPDSQSTAEHQVTDDGGIKLVFLALAAILLIVVARFLWKRYRKVWEDAKAGAVILHTPRLYVTRVLSLQVASYVARMGVNATYMFAFGIPVSIRNIFLIIAANSISSTFAVTPGGVGTQQALASVALRDVAPASTVTAYSLAQQLISMAWNITFGLIMMITTFGWSTTKGMIKESRKEAKQKRSLSDLEQEDEPDAAGADVAG